MAKPKVKEVQGVKKRLPYVSQKKPLEVPKSKKDVTSVKSKSSKKEKGNISVTVLKENPYKIQIIHNLSKKKIVKEVVIDREATVKQVNVQAISLFKVPLHHPQLVSNVARYSGTIFVVLGAFFTVYNMSTALSVIDESALLAAQTTASTCTTADCLNESTTQTTSTIDPCSSGGCQPNADIRVESSSNTLTGTVPINVTVSQATQVDIDIVNKDTNLVTHIGTMFRVSDMGWRLYWQTANFDDGRYRINAVIKNQYSNTPYTVQSSSDYLISNHPIETTAATSDTSGTDEAETTTVDGTTDPTTTDETTTIATTETSLSSVRVELGMQEPLSGVVSVRTYVTDASSVKIYARPANESTAALIGYASLYAAGEWRYSWNTSILKDGDYDLKVQAIFPNNTSNYRTLSSVTIENSDVDTSPIQIDSTIDTSSLQEAALEPDIDIHLSKSNPLSNTVDVYINVAGATFVELYARPAGSLLRKFLGLAVKQSDSSWRYRFDTVATPNGYYDLFANVRHVYGDSLSSPTQIRIENIPPSIVTPEEQKYLETLKTTGEEVETFAVPQTVVQAPVSTETGSDEVEEISTFITTTPSIKISYTPSPYDEIHEQFEDEESLNKAVTVIDQFKIELDRIIFAYGKALRENDTEGVRALQNELEQIKEHVLNELPLGEGKEAMVTRINEYLSSIIKDLRERTEKSETLIRERVGDAVTKDTDSDGISDYDEVNLYGTDLFSADTDRDGFNDGIEILNGYDPKNSERETNVQYESPREQGVVREDLLTVEYITTVAPAEAVKTAPKAHISGKALPNSFVTLYVFSTPIVVTVKADSTGSWSYIFDKELEDGEHEVYVGITDNAGRIVAKSNPLSFVKTAEAFTPIDAQANAVTVAPQEPSLISEHVLLVIGSLSVVSLGLVLILLGLHVRPKDPQVQLG